MLGNEIPAEVPVEIAPGRVAVVGAVLDVRSGTSGSETLRQSIAEGRFKFSNDAETVDDLLHL
jgi:hypothetical protein